MLAAMITSFDFTALSWLAGLALSIPIFGNMWSGYKSAREEGRGGNIFSSGITNSQAHLASLWGNTLPTDAEGNIVWDESMKTIMEAAYPELFQQRGSGIGVSASFGNAEPGVESTTSTPSTATTGGTETLQMTGPESINAVTQGGNYGAGGGGGWWNTLVGNSGTTTGGLAKIAGKAALTAYSSWKAAEEREKQAEWMQDEARRRQDWEMERVNRIRSGPLSRMAPFLMSEALDIYSRTPGGADGRGFDVKQVAQLMGLNNLDNMKEFDGWS